MEKFCVSDNNTTEYSIHSSMTVNISLMYTISFEIGRISTTMHCKF